MFIKKKKALKIIYTLIISFFTEGQWVRVIRDLDDGTTIEQAQNLMEKIKNQTENNYIDIGCKNDHLSNTAIFLKDIERAVVDVKEKETEG